LNNLVEKKMFIIGFVLGNIISPQIFNSNSFTIFTIRVICFYNIEIANSPDNKI